MTHLRIEQNTGVREQVGANVLSKLYDLAMSGTLDSSSNIEGWIKVPYGYREQETFLETNFPLTIDIDTYYVYFQDPEANRILKDAVTQNNRQLGDGTGVFESEFTQFTRVQAAWFKDNTTIQTLNELSKATSCTEIYAQAFKGCSSLTSINLANITTTGTGSFQNCSSLTNLGDTSNLQYIDTNCFSGCSSLSGTLSFPSVTTVGSLAFNNSSNLTCLDFGENLTSMNWQSVWNCASGLKMIFRGQTPPTVSGTDTRLYNKTYTIYIPDGCLSAYTAEAHFNANSSKIHYISELSTT